MDSSSSFSDEDLDDKSLNKKLAVKHEDKEKSARTVRDWYYLDDNEDFAIASQKETAHCSVDGPRKLRNITSTFNKFC